ncbi:MAG: hypothetical protein J6I56_01115 [Lachnospiraceae bacterium]|nr:hypothetical protein [Lachnospiraceae bacterium]
MKPDRDLRKLVLKLCLCLVPLLLYAGVSYSIDTFNVFHYDHIRFTKAEPNKNYIKTRYVTEHPERFNAFVFGSSRVANLPREGLPDAAGDGTALSWYNMTYPMGCPIEHLQTLRTFLAAGVGVRMIVMGIDEISMYQTLDGAKDPIRRSYQEYEKNPLRFFYSYLVMKPEWELLPAVMFEQNTVDAIRNRKLFYDYGVDVRNTDLTVPEEPVPMASSLGCGEYNPETQAIESIAEIVRLCEENDIELTIFSSPVLQSTYEEAVEKGYLEFLGDVAGITEFHNFSGLNEYTTDYRYYFDASHYRPYVGLQMEKVMFGE